MITKKIIKYVALLLTLVMLLSLCACSSGVAKASLRAGKTVARAGGTDIPYETLYFLAMNQIADMKAVYGEKVFEDPARVQELKDFVYGNLFGHTEAMVLIGAEYGLDLSKGSLADQVQAYVDTMLANNFENDHDSYIEMLDAGYMTDNYLRTYIGVSEYLTDAIIREMLQRGELDDSDEAAMAAINGADFVHVYQVLIDPALSRLTDEEAKAKAEKLRESVAAAEGGEARFDAMRVAIQSSLAVDGGEGLYFGRGEMEDVFEQAAFALEDYGVSEVFATDDGYRFLLRMPKDAAYIDDNFEELKQKTYYITLNRMAETLIAETEVELTSYGESLDLLDLPEISAEGGEWVDIVITLGGIGVAVALVVVLVKFWPDKEKKSKKS